MEQMMPNQGSDLFIVPSYSDEDLQVIMKEAMNGNLPAKMNLILHNQKIINKKLDVLMQNELMRYSAKEANGNKRRESEENSKKSEGIGALPLPSKN